MTEDERKADELDRRLRDVRQAYNKGVGKPSGSTGGSASGGGEKLGVGMRIAIEMVAGVVVGAFLGLMADRWLGTKPWLLIVGFMLGCGAAFMNVYRVAQAEEKRDKAERDAGSKK
jgi:ATP synthase protein I